MKFIITEDFHVAGIEILERDFTVDCRLNISRSELIKCISEYDVVIVRSDTPYR